MGIAISLDNFAAALALGTRIPRSSWVRTALTFATFGGISPVAGVYFGRHLSAFAATWASALGVAALVLVGVVTIVRARRARGGRDEGRDPPTFLAIALLAVTLSGDNFVVGFGLGLRGIDPLAIGVLATATVLLSSYLGLTAGQKGFRRWGRRAEIGAGVVLILVGIGLAAGVL